MFNDDGLGAAMGLAEAREVGTRRAIAAADATAKALREQSGNPEHQVMARAIFAAVALGWETFATKLRTEP